MFHPSLPRRALLLTGIQILATQVWGQPLETKLTHPEPEAHDRFGWSVSLDGERALVGARGDDAPVTDVGSAFLFERQSEGVWTEVVQLTASDADFLDLFGSAVSVSGDIALIGSLGDDVDFEVDSGSAYVFERQEDGAWLETAKLTAFDGAESDFLGIAASLSGTRACVGAYGKDELTGAAYVFERQEGGAWVEAAKLEASDRTEGDWFGWATSLDGDLLLVGAPQHGDVFEGSGAVYVFERQEDGTWIETVELGALDKQEEAAFGISASLEGDRALIGASADNDLGDLAGAAYVFERRSDGTWVEAAKLTASDGAANDRFGDSVSLSGDVALVGAYWEDEMGEDSGSAYLFRRQPDGAWVETFKLTASDGAPHDFYGRALSLSGERALVGAFWHDVGGFENAGAAYIYEEIPIIVETPTEAPETPLLSAVAPNPFADHAQVTLTPGAAQHVRLEVFDMLGRRVALLHEGVLPGGVAKSFTLNAAAWPGGVYVLRVVGETFVESRTLTVIR